MVGFVKLAVVAETYSADAARMLEELRREEASANPGDVISHEHRVALSTRALAKAAGVSRDDVELMTLAARYHDIGKLDIPAAILNKPGRFTPEERALVERHAELGAVRLERIPGISPTMVDAARYHHERFDGNGYARLTGEEIPLVARIIAIADVHDALGAKRVYKEPMPEAEVLLAMTSDDDYPALGHRAFDPGLLRTFVGMRLAATGFEATESQMATLQAFADSPAPETEATFRP